MKAETDSNVTSGQTAFIPARENRWVLYLFGLVVRWLFFTRFSNVNIRQEYFPTPEKRTIYYLNHTSWWDGILPLLLNQTRFHQRARAVMELRQMKEFSVFSYIGAFSIDLSSSKSIVRSMRYALESMKRNRASLFIYPEGKINSPSDELPGFESGIGWLIRNCNEIGLNVDIVPVAVHTHVMTASKPELWVEIGMPVKIETQLKDDFHATKHSNKQIADQLHAALQTQLKALKSKAFSTAFPALTPLERTPQST